MLFAFILIDKPDHDDLRQRLRSEHTAYLGTLAERIAFAGPLTTDDGQIMIGSLLVLDFSSRDEAHAWIGSEPFNKAGLYASTFPTTA